MNICVVSSFEGSAEDFLSMFHEIFDEEIEKVASDYDIGVVIDKDGFCKIITTANVIDEQRFSDLMSSPKMVEGDKNHKNTDVIYSLERIN
tara:strand:- start:925 stop:1197 length:273 start_codon:yes stop_codon:yes gene_type:complete